jgi:hypothetical protein
MTGEAWKELLGLEAGLYSCPVTWGSLGENRQIAENLNL